MLVVEVTRVEPVANHSLVHATELKTEKKFQFWVDGEPDLTGRLFKLSDVRLKPLYENELAVWGVQAVKEREHSGE